MTVHVHSVLRVIGLAMALALLLIPDYVEAQYGGARRRTRRRTAVVVSSATHEQDQAAAEAQANEEAAAKADTTATKEEAPAPAPAPPAPETGGQPLPVGTVASKLPEGCESVAVDGVTYYHGGGNYYRAVFQEDTLVYVTVDPPK